MSSRIGSDQNFIATTSAGILDDQANSIVSSDTTFGSSPLGVAARTQALFGIANANFNLTPPDPTLPIVDNDNPLPYWTIENGTEGDGSAVSVFDDATSTWGVELSLGTSITDAAISMTTRSFLLNDDNLALRQKALAVLSKSGTAGGTAAQWNLVLSAEYFSAAGSSLSSYSIGTVTDVTTWTSISGTTTAGGSAISSSAAYVDMTFTMTALGTVTGSAKATIKSLLLTTTSPTTGGGLLVTDTFTSSGTWTRPTGVDYLLAVCAVGAGGGGGAVDRVEYGVSPGVVQGAGGGGGGAFGIIRDVNLGTVTSVSVGIGAGGGGAIGGRVTKVISTPIGSVVTTAGTVGSNGGATTFGAYLSVGGGTAGGLALSGQAGTAGGAGPLPTSTVFGLTTLAGGAGGSAVTSGTAPGLPSAGSAFTNGIAYVSFGAGSAGGTASNTSTGATVSITIGTAGAGGTAGIGGGGGSSTPFSRNAAPGGWGGGGGGGAGIQINITASGGTASGTGGVGGDGGSATGGGGGAGGPIVGRTGVGGSTGTAIFNGTGMDFKAGNGGAGSGGAVYVVYVA